MANERTFVAADRRRAVAHQTVVDHGAGYLNSLVGGTAGATCRNIEALMPFLQKTIDRRSGEELDDMRPIISFLVQSIWTAVQYEMEADDHE